MNSSKTTKFSDEELERLKVWTLPGVNDDESEQEEEGQLPMVTVEQIEAIQKTAYDEGFAQGKEDGFQQGMEEGRKQGYDQGLKDGYEENKHLLQEQAAEFSRLMETLAEPFKDLDEKIEKELVKLSIAIATKLLRRELKTDPGQVVAAVKQGVEVLPMSSQKVTVTLHPDDAILVRNALELDTERSPWNIQEDPLITRGGCKIDTEQSHVDATVENKLSLVIAQVMGGERREDS